MDICVHLCVHLPSKPKGLVSEGYKFPPPPPKMDAFIHLWERDGRRKKDKKALLKEIKGHITQAGFAELERQVRGKMHLVHKSSDASIYGEEVAGEQPFLSENSEMLTRGLSFSRPVSPMVRGEGWTAWRGSEGTLTLRDTIHSGGAPS